MMLWLPPPIIMMMTDTALTLPGQVTGIPVANSNTVGAHRACLWT
jgi:hypothetical protein